MNQLRTHVSARRITALAFALSLTALPTADAHLGIVRQGKDSAAVMEPLDQHGRSVAAGDFNGDGRDDLAVGSLDAVGAIVAAGAVVVSYGCPTGITHLGAHSITQNSLGDSSETQDRFGWALAAGDFNNDGRDDLAIGSPGEDSFTGQVTIIYGTAGGLNGSTLVLSQDSGPGTPEAGDNFGAYLATGDFNGDGYADLAVASITESLELPAGTINNAGAVSIYFGGPGGLSNTGAFIFSEDDLVGGGTHADSTMGRALAAGDINNDGRDDLVVGINRRDFGGVNECGAVVILYGTATGPTMGYYHYFTQAQLGAANEDLDRFGSAIAVGDTNGDGFDDVAFGSPEEDVGALVDAGAVIVAYGSAAGLQFGNATIIVQNDIFPAAAGNQFGYSVAFGDMGGDGLDELAVGIPNQTGSPIFIPGSAPEAGMVITYTGRPEGISSSVGVWKTQNELFDTPENGDHFGWSLAFGNFAGGARKGLAIGCPDEGWNPNPQFPDPVLSNAGAVYMDIPWKQVQSLWSRGCIVVDCGGNILFSQKPFQQVRCASTSKTMTLLLAAEAIDNGLPTNIPYTFPQAFVSVGIPAPNNGTLGGSMARFCTGEVITFMDLLRTAFYASGNDSCFAIADYVVNPNTACGAAPPCNEINTFVNMMNTRAAQLGMTDTVYGNPAGPTWSAWGFAHNISTPADMYKLASTAMEHPLVHQIASEPSYTVLGRQFVWNGGNQNAQPPVPPSCTPAGNPYNAPYNTQIWCLPGSGNAANDIPYVTGMKLGNGDSAGECVLISLDLPGSPGGRAFILLFGCPSPGIRNAHVQSLAALVSNTQACTFPFVPAPPPPGRVDTLKNNPVWTHTGPTVLPLPLDEGADRGLSIRATCSAGTPSAQATLQARRTIEVELQPGESTTLSVAPYLRRGDIILVNRGAAMAVLQATMNQPAFSGVLTIPPGGTYDFAPHAASSLQPGATLMLTNASSTDPALLEIAESGYQFDLALAGSGGFTVRMTADRRMGEDSLEVALLGQDPSPTAKMDLMVANTFDADPACDGSLDLDDVPAFVMALADPAAYEASFPACFIGSADRNSDGRIDGLDVGPFVAELLAP